MGDRGSWSAMTLTGDLSSVKLPDFNTFQALSKRLRPESLRDRKSYKVASATTDLIAPGFIRGLHGARFLNHRDGYCKRPEAVSDGGSREEINACLYCKFWQLQTAIRCANGRSRVRPAMTLIGNVSSAKFPVSKTFRALSKRFRRISEELRYPLEAVPSRKPSGSEELRLFARILV